jgi:hypothetical protein
MTTDRGITFAVIAVAIIAMATLHFGMAQFETAGTPVGVSAETTSSIPN